MGLLHNSEDRSILTPVFPPSLTDQWSAHSPCPRPQFQDSTQALQAEALIIRLFLAGCAPRPKFPAPGPLESSYSSLTFPLGLVSLQQKY